MTITYPLTLPADPSYTVSRITTRAAVASSQSPFTLEEQFYVHQGQRWEFELTLPPMKRALAAEWQAKLVSLNGRQGTFLLGDPDARVARGVATGTPLVNGASQTGLVLVTDGWTPNTTNILRAGDYIQLGSGSTARLHILTANANSDSGGNATLDIWPRLRYSPANNAAITVSNCVGLFRLASNDFSWDADRTSLYGISFAAVEAL